MYSKQLGLTFKNVSEPIDSKSAAKGNIHYSYNKEQSMAALHLMMFVAGALAVSVLNKKQEIIRFIKRKLEKINIRCICKNCVVNLKYPAIKLGVAVAIYLPYFWEKIKTYVSLNALRTTQSLKQRKLYTVMLNKLKEIGEERKNLGQLLITAIQANKNIRMQYQLETMAKNRLAQHIEITNKERKENRSRYVSFQHLYLVTHQENIFLKARIKKLTKEKEDVEKNLMGLISEVYKTKNNELKSYCSRYIVKTKDNLLNCDVSAEIEKFLRKARNNPGVCSTWHPERSRVEITSTKSWPLRAGTRISEILQDDSLVPLVTDSPKLKGLPGEYVWTVKDKDGIIEKLYEYDNESEFDGGETIRKIRQYSVYYDKDCLLDFTKYVYLTLDDRKTYIMNNALFNYLLCLITYVCNYLLTKEHFLLQLTTRTRSKF